VKLPDLPKTMTHIAISAPGGPEALVAETIAVPEPGPEEVLIRVAAAGVNRPDVVQRQGHYRPPPGAPSTPGLEVAGEIVARGANAGRYDIGAPVAALVAGGGYAEYCVCHQGSVLRVPEPLSLVEAAGVPETFFTVWTNVFDRGGLRAGETFLVHGGASGIGTTAIQLGRVFGATVYATAGSAEKCARCESLGARRAINYRDEDFVAVIKEETGGRGVDLILDMVGGDYVARNYSAAAPGGRIVQIAFLRGARAETDLARLMLKQLTHTGSTLRSRSVAEKAAIARALEDSVWPFLDDGTIAPIIDSTFPLAAAARAHERMETGAHFGKIILTVEQP
jgi:putative PIG3 family NAD(P)H quinone oxidoreductase